MPNKFKENNFKNSKVKKLNLGCGQTIKKGFINVDFIENQGVDVVHDLNLFPYPFEDNSFDLVLLSGVLEHLDNPDKVLREVWRISKDKSKTFILVPHFTCWGVWGDITHKRGFNSTSLMPYDIKYMLKKSYSSSLLNKNNTKFRIRKKILFGKIKRLLGFQLLVNLNNLTMRLYEKNIGYIFPADNIVFELEAVKRDIKNYLL